MQDYKAINLAAGRGVAVRKFPTSTGPMDYMLYADRRGIGSIEAKKAGETLLGVEPQADWYSDGFSRRAKKDGTRGRQLVAAGDIVFSTTRRRAGR